MYNSKNSTMNTHTELFNFPVGVDRLLGVKRAWIGYTACQELLHTVTI